MPRFRPGCMVRSTLALLGVLFLPFGIWMLWQDPRRNWLNAVLLLVVSVVALYFSLDRRGDSWVSRFDDM